MSVMSVNGPLAADSLGVVSPHEHLLIDIRNQFTEFTGIARRARSEGKVCLENMDALSRNPYAVKDNLVMDDVALAAEELMRFNRPAAIPWSTRRSPASGRDPDALRDLSRATGVTIIAGCGYYTGRHPPGRHGPQNGGRDPRGDPDNLRRGMDATQIRAGVIGEIGTSAVIQPGERKCWRPRPRRSSRPGSASSCTPTLGASAVSRLRKSCAERASRRRRYRSTTSTWRSTWTTAANSCARGVFIEFDDFGKEYFIDRRDRGFAGGVFARDIERVLAIKTFSTKAMRIRSCSLATYV